MLVKYKYLLWDVDGTLLDFPYSQRIGITKCLEEIGVEVTEEMICRYAQINDGWWKRLELNEVTKKELLVGRFTDLFEEYKIICPDVETFMNHYQLYLGEVYKYIEDSLEVCKELQGNYKQYVVTNGVKSTQQSKLKLSGFDKVMDQIFISEELGVPKPQIEFFEKCFERIAQDEEDFDKEQALIIGDALSSDIKGGNNAGIATCWYNPTGQEKDLDVDVTFEIKRLRDIFTILN